ncbi:ACP S-malonyltransferase [Moritella marina ATCC 15381]|uniref:Malonyl CoA-acyl carrier protein transacylase n=2 Tax=Moritella marina TaxID=90736 RepID=A0A5J6WJT0_MORMI|nr:ACP S-malonyltransferase [Moritella marina]QFI37471.1 ACP S-malonyltransferase [Moritella marina ATCC 15381]BAA85255.1 malonyl Coenzyme A-acyl carrier protein transacylase (malonyl CoA-ACP transacylase (MCT)) homolog [Moritella marina ATCC 15381]
MSKYAVVFPGQGSQTIGMLADLAAEHSVVEQTFAQASEMLGYDLWDLVQHGTVEELSQTHITQPALLATSVALWRIAAAKEDFKPALVAGHSLGEYSALVCAGVIKFEDAIALVELRGQLMQQAVPQGIGAMAAVIGLDNDAIIAACATAAEDEVVSAVNFNSPGQVVIAGNKAAVVRASELCVEAGARRVMPLPVSVPSHCSLMKPAADELKLALEKVTFNTPVIKLINNVDVAAPVDAESIKDALVRQLYMPVRWTEVIEAMAQQEITALYEFGPGKVLTGLVKRIDKTIKGSAVNNQATIADFV